MNTKLQVIVRKDLNLTPGALAAQVAHLTMEWFRFDVANSNEHGLRLEDKQIEWLKDPYLYVLAVDNIEELNWIHEQAFADKIASREWTDVIWSENLKIFRETKIGVVLGPDDSDKLKLITGNLPLY